MQLKYLPYLLIGVFLLNVNILLAQQDPHFTQYMYNTVSFNPAYAGSNGTLNANLLHRSQWVGLEGAPTTQLFSINSPVGGGNTALGLSFINDKIGPSQDFYVTVDASYTIPFDNDIRFAFGIKAGLQSLQVDYNKLAIYNPTDARFNENVNNQKPQIGIGSYLYAENWYLGLSIPNVLKTDFYDAVTISTAAKRQHFHLIAGYVFQLNENLKFKPATLVKIVSGAPIAYDLSANFLLNDKITLGGAYRLDASISALAGFQISDSLMIGYGYDFDTTELARYNSGSHEVFLKFEVFNKIKGRTSPRFF
ncbi:type IX secretion system membrane protein PorP/SprF [Flavivirga spongiicola]|uniref:Type IX secretion system membrane protein PorP/SprF n=1 Tax=Flavivirga spongiicola TaxID=421621 RepID=A0ABU7XRS2_9FLAO|nr:type IX secretion system membrane protein PorP/SprF [Flavivirga sp. MEBiC05379]MDO5978123.1 type IX secretion system membrane protein PorP/SprF [Flavivirga sp. MEBiC05379]